MKKVKNTAALYLRQAIVLAIQLFVTRLVLKSLGEIDFGIYSVIGSVVVLFSFLNSAMSTASQRFITFELGKGTKQSTSKVFSVSMVVQICLALALLVILEVVGLWFLNNQLNIPPERLQAANYAFHFCLLTFFFSIIRVPYDASVIAHEKLTFFAYTGIIEVLLRLLVAILLLYSNVDKLVLYAGLLSSISILMFLINRYYGIKKLGTCDFSLNRNVKLYRQLFTYTGWTLLGSGTNILTQQGFIFLINIFYGVIVNAAMGIANQVISAISGFTSGFLTSYRPQIIKFFAQKDYNHVNYLISFTSKTSFLLMTLPVLLLIFNMQLVLGVWLDTVPKYAVEFCQIMLICTFVDAITSPYNTAVMASENIKNYQYAISSSFLLDLVVSYILMRLDFFPYIVLISRFFTRGIVNMIIGLVFIKRLLDFDILTYFRKSIIPMIFIIIFLSIILYVMKHYLDGWYMMVFSSIIICPLFVTISYFLLLSVDERIYVRNFVIARLKK